jgi:hypothetical protein
VGRVDFEEDAARSFMAEGEEGVDDAPPSPSPSPPHSSTATVLPAAAATIPTEASEEDGGEWDVFAPTAAGPAAAAEGAPAGPAEPSASASASAGAAEGASPAPASAPPLSGVLTEIGDGMEEDEEAAGMSPSSKWKEMSGILLDLTEEGEEEEEEDGEGGEGGEGAGTPGSESFAVNIDDLREGMEGDDDIVEIIAV